MPNAPDGEHSVVRKESHAKSAKDAKDAAHLLCETTHQRLSEGFDLTPAFRNRRLGFGISLELGIWELEFFPGA
jgi:hypothetical protein